MSYGQTGPVEIHGRHGWMNADGTITWYDGHNATFSQNSAMHGPDIADLIQDVENQSFWGPRIDVAARMKAISDARAHGQFALPSSDGINPPVQSFGSINTGAKIPKPNTPENTIKIPQQDRPIEQATQTNTKEQLIEDIKRSNISPPPEKKKSSGLKKTLVIGGAATATVLGLAFCAAQNETKKTTPSNGNINPALPLPNDGKPRQLYRVTEDARLYDTESKAAQNIGLKKDSCVIGDVVSNDPKRVGSAQTLILSHDGKRALKAYMYGSNLQSNGTATNFADCKSVFTTMAAPMAAPPQVVLPPVQYAQLTGTVNLRLSTDRSKKEWGYIESGSCVVLEGPQRDGMAKISARMENHPERMQSGFWVIQTSLQDFSPADKTQCFAKMGKGEIGAAPAEAAPQTQAQTYPAPLPAPVPSSPSTQAFAAYSVVSAEDAEILREPSFSSGIKTSIKAGECILVKGKDEASGFTEVAVRKSGVMVSGWLGALNYDVNQYCDFTQAPAPSGSRQPERMRPDFSGATSYRTVQPTTFSDQPERGVNVITLRKNTCVKLQNSNHPTRAQVTLEDGSAGWVSKRALTRAPECG